jgi:imidazolonepropionase-like amidohydrolase
MWSRCFCLAGAIALGLEATPVRAQAPGPLLLRGRKVLPMDQPRIDGGEVLLRDGKVAAVGRNLEQPAGTRVLEFADGWIVPGFVELHCHVGGSHGDTNDMVLPHNMDLRTLDTLRQQNPELDRAAAAGVTTALCIPGSGSSIGGLGTLIKTKGPSFDERLIRFPGALKIALHARGGNPSRHSGDLGASRLGLHWMLREVMIEAKDYHEACTAFERGRAPKPPFSPRLDPLRGLFRGEFPCILHAYGADDTMTAVRILHWGLGIPIVISHGEYESFVVGKELAAIGVPLNIGPTLYEFTEGKVLGNASELFFAGVRTSLCTDAPVIAQEELPLQAAMACRLGLPSEEALRGVTLAPALAIGIGNRVGSLTPGKDADVAVFAGDPLDPRNAPVLVLIDGRVVHEAGTRLY